MDTSRLTRRNVLKLGAAATAAFATTTNIFTPLKTFAARDQKLVFWLQPNFNPTADKILEEQTMAFARQAGLKDHEVQILKVPGGEVAARMTAALEVGAPPDVTRTSEFTLTRWKGQRHLLDVSDIMNDLRKTPGGVNPAVIPVTEDGVRYYAVPMGLSPMVFYARMDLLEKAGYNTFPETWDKFIEAALKIQKPPFYAYGMALGTTLGYSDSTHEIIAILWAHGGRLLDKNSRPVFNSPGTVKAFQLIKDMYHKHQIIPRGAVTWDNSGNNKAYQSKQVAFVHDGTSIFSYLLLEDRDLADRTGLFPAPGGPAGRLKMLLTDYYVAFKATPYPEIAKGLIRYFLEQSRYNEFVVRTEGRYMPAYPKLLEDPFWTSKPQFAALREVGREGVPLSWEGKMSPGFGEVVAQSMLSKAIHTVLIDNVAPADAVATLQAEMVATYNRLGEPV
jgi:multiple sugar transport system substrate-binding protein